MTNPLAAEAPLRLLDTSVADDWIDYNGHMNDAAYALVFSRAVDRFMAAIGLDEHVRRASGRTMYTLQMMIHYFREAKTGEPLAVVGRVVEHDDRRMRLFLEMTGGRDGPRLAASEQLLACVDQSGERPRLAPFPPASAAALAAMAAAHARLPVPAEVGLPIRLRK